MTPRFRIGRHALAFLLCCLLALACTEAALWNRKSEEATQKDDTVENDDIPGVPFLIEALGKELYKTVNKPKYKFALYMTIGKLPDEVAFVTSLNMVCNLLYSLAILAGFCIFPRGYMLTGTALTIFVGPALVLILIAIAAIALAAFALYPLVSVTTMWLFFFLSSQLAQVLGRKLGLDQDNDGDVDWLDVLHYIGNTKIGKVLRVDKLHTMLNDSSMDPFQAIHRRLDEIQQLSIAGSGREQPQKIPHSVREDDLTKAEKKKV